MKHLLIDFEHIQIDDLTKIREQECQIWLFLNPQQTDIPLDLCEALLRFGTNVHFVIMEKSGSTATDFYFAFYMGRITQTDAAAQICILSSNRGFDTLIEHADGHNMANRVMRTKSLTGKSAKMLTSPAPAPATQAPQNETKPVQDLFEEQVMHNGTKQALEYLNQNSLLPGNHADLLKILSKLLKIKLSLSNKKELINFAEKIANNLISNGFISIDSEQKLCYHLSPEDADHRLIQRILSSRPSNRADLLQVIESSESDNLVSNETSEQKLSKLANWKVFTLNNDHVVYTENSEYLDDQTIDVIDAEIIEEAIKSPAQRPSENKKSSNSSNRPSEKPQTLSMQAQKVLSILQKIKRNKPVSPETLKNSIVSWLQISPKEAAEICTNLQHNGIIQLNNNRLEYNFKP